MGRFALTFIREKSVVRIVTTTHHKGCDKNWNHYFDYNACSEAGAAMLIECFERRMEETLNAIRKDEYERGWADAKAKRAKQSYFSSYWRGVTE